MGSYFTATSTGTNTFSGRVSITKNDKNGLSIYNNSDSPDNQVGVPSIGFYRASASGGNLTPATMGHVGGLIFYPYFDGGYDVYGLTMASLISPRWNYVTHKDNPEQFMHIGTHIDGDYFHSFVHKPEGTLTNKNSSIEIDPFLDNQMTIGGNLEIYNADSAAVGSELLDNPTSFSDAFWVVDGAGCTKSGADIVCTADGNFYKTIYAGTDLISAGKRVDNRRVLIVPQYTISSCGGASNPNLNSLVITDDFVKSPHDEDNTLYGNWGGEPLLPSSLWADQTTGQRWASCGTTDCQRVAQVADAPTRFQVNVDVTGPCTITFTYMSVKEVIAGDAIVHGKLTGGGSKGIKVNGEGSISLDTTSQTITTEANIQTNISSYLLITGDNDADNDAIDLQNGAETGTILTIISAANVDIDDTITINMADTTCTNCKAIVFDELGENTTLYWTGATWVITSLETDL